MRLTLAAAVATSALALVPGAQAQEQKVCRGTRYIYTSEFTIAYPYFYLCP